MHQRLIIKSVEVRGKTAMRLFVPNKRALCCSSVFIGLFIGLLMPISASWAAAPIIAVTQEDRILLKQDDVEMSVPIPAGYVSTNYRRINLKPLPMLAERKLLAAFVKRIDKSNEYQVAPQPQQNGPAYYFVYAPKLSYQAATSSNIVDYLAEFYSGQLFEQVSATQRYAMLRPDEDTLTITWADIAPHSEGEPEASAQASENCIHTAAYQKGEMLVMFDTIEACGIDAASVKAHGEAWLERIKSANEPLPYVEQLLAEKLAEEAELAARKAANEAKDKPVADSAAKAQSQDAEPLANEPMSPVVWLLMGALLGIGLWLLSTALKQRLDESRTQDR